MAFLLQHLQPLLLGQFSSPGLLEVLVLGMLVHPVSSFLSTDFTFAPLPVQLLSFFLYLLDSLFLVLNHLVVVDLFALVVQLLNESKLIQFFILLLGLLFDLLQLLFLATLSI